MYQGLRRTLLALALAGGAGCGGVADCQRRGDQAGSATAISGTAWQLEKASRHNLGELQKRALQPAEIYRRISPAVVTITTKNEAGQAIASGSGFFISFHDLNMDEAGSDRSKQLALDSAIASTVEDATPAYVVTSYHVTEGAVSANVSLHNGHSACVVNALLEDKQVDLALWLVTVNSKDGIATLELSDVPAPVGSRAYAVGSPAGLEASYSSGEISGHREFNNCKWLQTTAPIGRGSSGGPLVGPDGRVIGVITAMNKAGQNLNFAVPSSTLQAFLASRFHRRFLWEGVSIAREEQHARTACLFKKQKQQVEPDPAGKALFDAYNRLQSYDAARQIVANKDKWLKSTPKDHQYLAYMLIGKAHAGLAAQDAERDHAGALSEGQLASQEEAYRNSAQSSDAIACYTRAALLKPDYSPCYDGLLGQYARRGEFSKALAAANKLVSLVPKCFLAYEGRGRCYERLGRYDLAVADFKRAAELNPIDAEIHTHVAEVYMAARQHDKAVASLEKAVELGYTPSYLCYFNMGTCYSRDGKYLTAIAMYQKAKSAGAPTGDCDREIARCRAKRR